MILNISLKLFHFTSRDVPFALNMLFTYKNISAVVSQIFLFLYYAYILLQILSIELAKCLDSIVGKATKINILKLLSHFKQKIWEQFSSRFPINL